MHEAKIIDAMRKALGNKGITTSGAVDAAGNVHCIGVANGKMVTLKIEGPTDKDATDKDIAKYADLHIAAVESQMAGK